MTTLTIAQQISALYGHDGQRFTATASATISARHISEGADLNDTLSSLGRAEWRDGYRTGDVVRYTLGDGSVITIAGDGWDYGYADCYCWAGAGHTHECEGA